jgi:putative membrane protein
MNQRGLYDNVLLVIKGLAMGIANKVPGVSGGIVAIVTGFYPEFLYSLKRLNLKAFYLLLTGRFKSFYQYTNALFLLLIALGILLSYFTVSKVLDIALLRYEQHVKGLFFGMVVMSATVLVRDFGKWNMKYAFYSLLGLVVGISLTFLEPVPENRNLLFVCFCGLISIIGMTLPGLSGSFLLILLGNYALLLVDAVNAVWEFSVKLLQNPSAYAALSQEYSELLIILLVFVGGSFIGLVSISNLLHYVILRFERKLNALIIGFIIGSLSILWPWSDFRLLANDTLINSAMDRSGFNQYFSLFWIGVGLFIVFILDVYDRKRQ